MTRKGRTAKPARKNLTAGSPNTKSLLLLLVWTLSSAAFAQQPDLLDRSLEDLMNMKVITVSKTEQSFSRTASAVFVITPEDIQQSGATNIPDLLRMVPGLDVAQINGSTWAISARGLNGRLANELFVMVDGRSVYSQSFGGVFWDVLDLPLEDIERIEVIRGPGGSIWGENAVNGVINIITRKASETHGGLITAGAGNVEQGFGTVQYGGSLGSKTDYRVFAKYLNQAQMEGFDHTNGDDAWHTTRGGFRSDTQITSKDLLTFAGDVYDGREDELPPTLASVTSPVLYRELLVPLSGGFFQSVWDHTHSAGSGISLQLSFEKNARADILDEHRFTPAIDFQHHFLWTSRQKIVWGLGYSFSGSQAKGTLLLSWNPATSNFQVGSGFIQDELAIVPDRLYLTGGVKVEHNSYTGLHAMPSVRVAWLQGPNRMAWAAASEARRTPSTDDVQLRVDNGGFIGPGGTPTAIFLFGNPRFQDEDATTYELGYRSGLARRVSLDLASYYTSYTNQQTVEPETPFVQTVPPPPYLVLPLTYQNLMHGEEHGLEAVVDWKTNARWTLSAGYAFAQIHMHLDPASRDTGSVVDAQGSSPVNSAQLRSHVRLARGVRWDASTYFTDRLVNGEIPSYTRLDSGLTWQARENFSCSVVGQNLLKQQHLEFIDDTGSLSSTLIKRSVFAKFVWRF